MLQKVEMVSLDPDIGIFDEPIRIRSDRNISVSAHFADPDLVDFHLQNQPFRHLYSFKKQQIILFRN